jgi:hypothetical protein
MPLRHAGSFGFDFGATEWFHDTTSHRYLVRVAVPDLATPLWDEVAKAIAGWWSAREGQSAGTDTPRQIRHDEAGQELSIKWLVRL